MTQGYVGIDYGLGQSNIDVETGIRYGVIAINSLYSDVWSDLEADYGNATCPKCGNDGEVKEYGDLTEEETEQADEFRQYDYGDKYYTRKHVCADYVCMECKVYFDSDVAFSDEPLGYSYANHEYIAWSAFDNTDLFITKSPYYTYAQLCSPCAPGAGNLNTPIDNGVKTYCLGEDWFDEDNPCLYPIYRVSDNERIYTPTEGIGNEED